MSGAAMALGLAFVTFCVGIVVGRGQGDLSREECDRMVEAVRQVDKGNCDDRVEQARVETEAACTQPAEMEITRE